MLFHAIHVQGTQNNTPWYVAALVVGGPSDSSFFCPIVETATEDIRLDGDEVSVWLVLMPA